MNENELILEAMKKAGGPLNAGKLAELTGLDRKVVDKAMAAMKKRRFHHFPRAVQVGAGGITACGQKESYQLHGTTLFSVDHS